MDDLQDELMLEHLFWDASDDATSDEEVEARQRARGARPPIALLLAGNAAAEAARLERAEARRASIDVRLEDEAERLMRLTMVADELRALADAWYDRQ